MIQDVARVDSTVLIEGETGTGKELAARAIHRLNHRRDKPFVAINCAGLSEELAASLLFGHRRGSFTGAVNDQQGPFEAAHGGTLFLDEIGDLPMRVQTTLLRVLEEHAVLRLGESQLSLLRCRLAPCGFAASLRFYRAETWARTRIQSLSFVAVSVPGRHGARFASYRPSLVLS